MQGKGQNRAILNNQTVTITLDKNGNLAIDYRAGKILGEQDGWILFEVRENTQAIFSPYDVIVHGSLDRIHWHDLAKWDNLLALLAPDANLLDTKYLRIKARPLYGRII